MIPINKELLLSIPITLSLSACAAVVPLASATYVTAASSAAASQTTKIPAIANRSNIDALRDHNLATQVNTAITEKIPTGRYLVASFNQKILIAGEVSTKTDIAKVTAAASHVGGVTKVWNYLTVGPNETVDQITANAYLVATTKKRLVDRQMEHQDVISSNIAVGASKGVVYLIGSNAGNKQTIEEVMTGMKQTEGVKKVINLIDQ